VVSGLAHYAPTVSLKAAESASEAVPARLGAHDPVEYGDFVARLWHRLPERVTNSGSRMVGEWCGQW
jgi:hypothetical protein